MAKSKTTIRQTNVQRADGLGHQLERSEVFDDSLLPEALEIERLAKIDPNIVSWLKERAEKEQDFRHEAYQDRIKVVRTAETNATIINVMATIFAFLIVSGGIWFSYKLIESEQPVTGSIFGGITILTGASLFLNHGKKSKPNSEG